jgi:hypothetical protein
MRPYLEKNLHKKGMVEWLKVKALSSSPSTGKKKNLNVYVLFDSVLPVLTIYMVEILQQLFIISKNCKQVNAYHRRTE